MNKVNPWQFLQVKLPTWGLFIFGALPVIIEFAMDKQFIPTEYHAIILAVVLPVLREIGKRIPQRELHEPQLNLTGVNTLISVPVANTSDLAWMVEAKKHLGLKENTSKTAHNPTILKWLKTLGAWWQEDETPWCGTFVAWCLKTAGVAYPKHWYRALDYVNYGSKLAKPAYGCVAIKTRNGGGHVCFVAGRDSKTGKLVCIGGNQSNMVCYALYNESDFHEFRWYGKTNRPADSRYNLPVLSGVTSTKVTEA
ncbi:TIGR02594 family protein [Acinetobacter gerneri]|uniref:TIGR02594 family protein n=1 Tax=Acinetobacter gerneri TaxID=202952 RepID=A0AAW8JF20_9GAMM|nr:TIGR02594 family protein [Acinetobacter gerneri]MDQ9009049.1 TIGR02594 family protein [Acinetobacter gerneri]MDQ9013153.1 TIGR02594 family protein [Acinetobacter gerneri]MDQ9024590.1 TIGR02594 family protein [Acinetobacter gerneri]MDQ9051825.1 TIGR02594 family protein [Acinetobacter gerneri]MDQ9059194.1 TIGR02594 family protein [Acinetobacter gerneri]